MSKTHDLMEDICNNLDRVLKTSFGRRMGFALFVFPFDCSPDMMGGNYMSNTERKEMVKALREILDRLDEGVIIPLLPEEMH